MAAALKRAAWVMTTVAAVAVIAALAAHGHRPDPGLVRFKPAGVMVEVPPEQITEVTVSRDARRWRFRRTGSGWTAAAGTPSLGGEVAAQLEQGLRFLHVSAPARVMAREEISDTPLAELGLAPPRYSVSVGFSGRTALTVEFGGLNPQGLAQYARVEGREEILLLPSFVGEPWEAVIDAR